MSAGAAIPLAAALAAASELRDLLAPVCARIEVAGSIRRRRPEVHDIEIVAVPRIAEESDGGLWGASAPVNLLDRAVAESIAAGDLAPRPVEVRRGDGTVEVSRMMGSAYRAMAYRGMPVDLFTTDAAGWGCILALRTGPGDWNRRLVTECKEHFRSVAGSRVLHLGREVPTPEEEDFFRALGVPWLDPWDRAADRLRFVPGLLRADRP